MTVHTAPHRTLPGVTVVLRDGRWIGTVRNEGHAGWSWGTYSAQGPASSYADALAVVTREGLTTEQDNAAREELPARHLEAWHAGRLYLTSAIETEHGVTIDRRELRQLQRGALRARP